MNRLHHRNDMIYRSIGKDTVTQVKDVARSPAGASENLPDPAADLVWWGKKRDWIQVSLDADVEPNLLPRLVQIYPPINADNVSACGADQLEQPGGPGAEVDHRSPRRQPFNGSSRVGKDVLLVVIRAQAPHPAVEELYRLRPCRDLPVEVSDNGP